MFTGLFRGIFAAVLSIPLIGTSVAAQLPDDSLANEIAKVLPAVVTIYASNAATQTTTRRVGSGFVIDPTGLILTNKHVIEGESSIVVVLSDGTALNASLVGAARLTDIALLRIPVASPLPSVARFGDSDKLRVGDTVFAIGNPLGLSDTVTVGIISGLNRNIMESPLDDYIQTDAAINHGNSGGPLINIHGKVIGMDSVIFAPGNYGGSIGLGFAIPSNVLKFVADQLREYGQVRPGWIGAMLQQPTPPLKDGFGLTQAQGGALVLSVHPHGPAANGGLQPGDVVLEFNGQTIADMRALARDVAAAPIGHPAKLTIWRNLARQTLTVTPMVDPRTMAPETPTPVKQPLPVETPHGLGLQLSGLNQALRASSSLGPDQAGLVVKAVTPNSAAADAGLMPGDLITRVEGCSLGDAASVTQCLHQKAGAGQQYVAMIVQRDKQSRWVAVPVASMD